MAQNLRLDNKHAETVKNASLNEIFKVYKSSKNKKELRESKNFYSAFKTGFIYFFTHYSISL